MVSLVDIDDIGTIQIGTETLKQLHTPIKMLWDSVGGDLLSLLRVIEGLHFGTRQFLCSNSMAQKLLKMVIPPRSFSELKKPPKMWAFI